MLLDLLAGSTRSSPPRCARWPPTPDTLDEVWPTLPRIAIDHAVAEPAAAAGRVAVVPGAFGWDDIGDFASLASLLPVPDERARRPGRPAPGAGRRQHRPRRPLGGRVVAVVGLDDVVVVDTGDAAPGHHQGARPGREAIVEELGGSRRPD